MLHSAGNGGRNRARARGRKAAKRATFPFINSQIIAVADTGDLDLLVSTIEGYMPEMNLVNVSTAMHRLAKLTASSPQLQTALQRHPVLTGLLASAKAALARTEVGCAPPQCQALSNITWSLATVQCVDLELLQTAARLSHRHVASFKPFELSAALWAFAKLDSLEPAACECAAELFQAAAEYIPANVEQFTFRCLVMTAWAYATARQHDERLFRGITAQMLTMIHTAQCQELANAAWAFSTAGVREDRLFAELSRKALRQIGDFKPQELSNMIWAFAAVGFFREDFFVVAAQTAQSMDLQAQQLANVLWALSRIRPRHRATAAAVLAMLPRCTRAIETFKPQELASVALAAAKCFGKSGGEPQDLPGDQPASATAALPPQVHDFFTAALPWVAPRLRYFSGQSLANVATSFLAVGVGNGSNLYGAIAREVFLRAQTLEAPALLLLLRNLPAASRSACGGAVCCLFGEAGRRLESLPAKELQVLSRICASLLGLPRNRVLSKAELASVCQALSKEEAWAAADVGSFARTEGVVFENALPGQAFEGASSSQVTLPTAATPEPPAGATATAAAADLPSALATVAGLPGFPIRAAAAPSPGALTSGGGTPAPSPPPPADAGGFSGATPAAASDRQGSEAGSETVLGIRMNYSVKNTFVDFSGEDEESASPSKPLPPPLDIIPRSVAPQKLEEYRMNYQKFRAGDAVGAKGELSTVMALDLASGCGAVGESGGEGDDEPEPGEEDSPNSKSCPNRGQRGPRDPVWPPAKFGAGLGLGLGLPRRLGAPAAVAPAPAADEGAGSSDLPVAAAGVAAAPPAAASPTTSSSAAARARQPCAPATPAAAGGASGAKGKKPPVCEEDLPPPLDFMPRFIDLEKLATFRIHYQQFRAGNAVGAKGEISNRTAPAPRPEDGKPLKVIKLPPPLDIIPECVSPRKLAAYRESYQKFRAGDAAGAKGEVSTAVVLDETPPWALDSPSAAQRSPATASRGTSSTSATTPLTATAVATPAHTPASRRARVQEAYSPGKSLGGEALPLNPTILSAPTPVTFSVKNTFVHVYDPKEREETHAVTTQPLPPALDIIPDSVPAGMLDAYRLDYQKFRAGSASGAKGEVSTLSALSLQSATHEVRLG